MDPVNATIEVDAETAKRLRLLAQKKGLSVEDLLRAYVPGLASASRPMMSQAERVAAFIRWAKDHPTDTPPLSDEAVSRRSFYE